MANTGKIERAAVRAVGEYLDRCPKVTPSINTNDKTPIWDGDIYIYKNDNHKNENFFARVPLQVKGTQSTKEINYFRLGRDYVKGYKKVNGTAFFLVQKGTGKVYYALLSVEIIDTLLQQTNQTIKIPLQKVPTNPLDFEKELYAFAASRNSVKVEKTSPKEIQELVEGFEEIRALLEEMDNKEARMDLESSLDTIKNLKDESPGEKDTIGWRDKFYYHSRKAIDLAINHIKGHDFTELQFYLGKYLQEQKQYHLAENYYRSALEEYRKRNDIVNVAMTLNNLAALHDDLTRYDEAEQEYKETLAIRRELAEINRDAYIGYVATTLNNLGNLHKNLTRYAEAEQEYNEALAIRRELADTNRDAYIGYVAKTLNNLAGLHWKLNQLEDTANEMNEVLAIYRELAKTNRDAYIGDVAMTLNNLGNLHKNLTRYDEAEEEYKEALAFYRELAETNRDAFIGYVATTLNNLGELHRVLTRYAEAETKYKEALAIRRELAKTNRDAYIGNVAMTLFSLALLQEATDRKEEAKKTAEEALDIYQELAETYPQIWFEYIIIIMLLLNRLN